VTKLLRAIEAFDLIEYLGRYDTEWLQGTERALVCPFCDKRKLIVNVEKRAWHCWYCEKLRPDAHGGLLDLIQLLEGAARDQAVDRVLDGFHGSFGLEKVEDLPADSGFRSLEKVTEIPLPNHCLRVTDHTGILPYCERRGISRWDAECFGLVWCTRGKYKNRLIFPVWEDHRIVYWQARAMWEKEDHGAGRYTKSLNPPKTEGAAGSGDVLYNLHQARQYPSVVITEGPIDAIHVGPDAVATFGKRLTPIQIGKLVRAGVSRVELMWDGPTEREPHGAWPEMFSVTKQLRELFQVRLVFVPKGDPGDYTRDQNTWFRQHSSRAPAPKMSHLLEV
jgi:hypothetical protein